MSVARECGHCGAEMAPGSDYCGKCGSTGAGKSRRGSPPQQSPPESLPFYQQQPYHAVQPQIIYMQAPAPPPEKKNKVVSGCAGLIGAGLLLLIGAALLLFIWPLGLLYFGVLFTAALFRVVMRA